MRMQLACAILAIIAPLDAMADVVLAARTVHARTILSPSDLVLQQTGSEAPISRLSQVVGLEARVVLYEGRPIGLSDIGPAAIIERNQIVSLVYTNGPLTISADGRALGRAGAGDLLKVMNSMSRKIIVGRVSSTGAVYVGADAGRHDG